MSKLTLEAVMNDTPTYTADRDALIAECRSGIDAVMNVARASQAESHHLVQQTNFMMEPTLAGANHILSRMEKWARALHAHRSKAFALFEDHGISEYVDSACLAVIDIEDFLEFVRHTKRVLTAQMHPASLQPPAAPVQQPMSQPAPNFHQSAQPGAAPAQPGMDAQLQQMMMKQRMEEMKALHEAQKASNAAMQQIVQDRMAAANRRSEQVRSVL